MKVTLARSVRLVVGPGYVELRWSAEALWGWLCRRNVHRIRWDFPMDCWACACGRDRFMGEEEREWLRWSYPHPPSTPCGRVGSSGPNF